MTLAAAVIVDTSLVLAIGLIAAMSLRRRSASLRHWVLVATMIAAALTPVLELMLPPWRLAFAAPSLEIAGTTPLTITSEPPAAAPTFPRDVFGRPGGFEGGQLLVALWATGTFVGLVVLCAGLSRLSRLATRAHVVTEGPLCQSMDALVATPRQRRVRLLIQATHPGLVVTWGMRRPTILLPSSATEWSGSRQRAVLLHELAHVERGDWAVRMFAVAMRCAFWFNPLMWIVDRRVQHESERACDDEVIRAGVSGTDYAGHLLAVAREAIGGRRSWSPATAVAQPSTLEERIHAMLTTGINRKPLGRLARVAAFTALVAGVIPLAAASPASRSGPADRIIHASPVAPSTPSAGAVIRPWSDAVGMGQSATASIVGVLYDQHSGLLPGVDVALTQDATGATQSVSSDSSGTFAFHDLPPGDYTLVTSLAGFQRVRNMLRLSAGAHLQRNILLPLGTLQETVTVSSDGSPGPSNSRTRPERQLPEPRIASPCVGRVGGCIKVPRKVFHVSPVYPAALAASGIGGQVLLTGRVGLDGYMSDLRPAATNAQVHPDLVASAIEAVRQWEFDPTYLNGAPVEAEIRITVNFTSRR
jgi:TonB family protein